MSFLAPLFLLGLAAIAVPIVLHLRDRPQAKRRRFSALEFLLASQRKMANRLRLRQILLLLARVGAIAAIPLALAKPFVEREVELPLATTRPQSAVIVLDDSLSMRWRGGGRRLFDRARGRAGEILNLLGPASNVALVLGSEQGDAPIPELTTDRTQVERVLAALEPSFKAADLPAAVRRAGQILHASSQAERRIFVLSDGAAHAWGPEGPPSGGVPEVVLIDVAPGKPPANHAVVALEVGAAPELGRHGIRVVADIANFSDAPVRALPVTLRLGESAVARASADIGPRTRVRKTFLHALPSAASYDAAVETTSDGLAEDDRRYARIDARKAIRVLLVSGDPRTVRREDETFYLETALRTASGEADPPLEVRTVPADALPEHLDADVIFLCNVKAPSGARAAELRDFVGKGGGLFLAMGDNVDPDAYNRALADLLPQPLQDRHLTQSGGETAAGREEPAKLQAFDRQHPVLRVFQDATGLLGARFRGFMLLTPRTEDPRRRTLLRFGNGAPALVELEQGAGRVILYASTVDRDWTDLPIRPDFLPLMQQIARHLAKLPAGEAPPPTLVGHPYPIVAPSETARLEVTAPSGTRTGLPRRSANEAGPARFGATSEPGFYRVAAQAGAGTLAHQPQLDFAVNVDAKESDFSKVGTTQSGELVAQTEAPRAAPPKQRHNLAHLAAALLLAFLVVESALARRG